jgi:putative PIN family toxin of toxin-antitoxin system
MIKVVLDANIFVSSIIVPKGNSAQIIDLIVKEKIELIISQSILEEVRRVLFYPHIQKRHQHNDKRIYEFIKDWARIAKFAPGKVKIDAIKDDPTDNKYLECAVEGKANYIVSGDKHLKKLKEYQGIKIVEPAVFLALKL